MRYCAGQYGNCGTRHLFTSLNALLCREHKERFREMRPARRTPVQRVVGPFYDGHGANGDRAANGNNPVERAS